MGIYNGAVYWALRRTSFVGFGVSKYAVALCTPDPSMVIEHLGETRTILSFRYLTFRSVVQMYEVGFPLQGSLVPSIINTPIDLARLGRWHSCRSRGF